MASMKSRFRPAHDAKLHMLAGPLAVMPVKTCPLKKEHASNVKKHGNVYAVSY